MTANHIEFSEIQLHSDKDFKQKALSSYQFLFIMNGIFQCQIGARTYSSIQNGDILLLPPETSFILTSLKEQSGLITVLLIHPDYWESVCTLWPQLNYSFEEVERRQDYLLHSNYVTWSGLFSVLDLARAEQQAKDFGWEVNLHFILMSLIMHIGRTYYYQNITTPKTEKRILDEQITSYIDTHITEPLTLKTVADHFHVCKETISRLFRCKHHCTFYQYLRSQRLVSAKNALLAGIPLKSIWEISGFSDYSSFYRAFKKEYGCSPNEYRKKRLEYISEET